MNNEIAKIIKDRMNKLPANIATAIENVPWLEETQNIARENNLSEIMAAALETETTILVLGMDSPKNYVGNLVKNVSLQKEVSERIAEEVDKRVVKAILIAAHEPPKSFLTEENDTDPEGINYFVGSPTDLRGSSAATPPQTHLESSGALAPSNLPTGEIAEEKILSSVGSPGEKLAWEQRKQITASALPKADEKKYNGVDPYREPLQ